jgi:hypothetical protein
VDIALPKSEESRIVRKAKLRLTPNGLEGKVTVTYTGLAALRKRLEKRNEDEVDKKQYLEIELQHAIPTGVNVTLTNTPEWSSSDKSFVVEYDLKVPGWVSRAGQQALLAVGLFSQGQKNTFKHSSRVHPLYFDYPNEVEDEIAIALPPNVKIASVPEAFSSGDKQLAFSTSAEEKNSELLIRRHFTTGLLYLDSKAYPQVRDFFQMIRAHDEQQVVLVPAKAETKPQ